MTRVLIDKDSVLYDINTPWYNLHNKDYSHIHTITADDVRQWDTSQVCKDNNCPADIYSYFNHTNVWTDGEPIQNSIEITQQWAKKYELGIVTTPANAMASLHSLQWLYLHYPHIPNIIMVMPRIKHWIHGDILIDDALHNLEHFSGIRILFDQLWNRDSNYLRAKDWNHLDVIIQRGAYLLEYWKRYDDKYNLVEHMLKEEFQ
jgi:5'(3')-deoxyribonucleotidase